MQGIQGEGQAKELPFLSGVQVNPPQALELQGNLLLLSGTGTKLLPLFEISPPLPHPTPPLVPHMHRKQRHRSVPTMSLLPLPLTQYCRNQDLVQGVLPLLLVLIPVPRHHRVRLKKNPQHLETAVKKRCNRSAGGLLRCMLAKVSSRCHHLEGGIERRRHHLEGGVNIPLLHSGRGSQRLLL